MKKMAELDLYLFNEGKLKEAYKHFGAHLVKDDSGSNLGVMFKVYAPHAKIVSVVGEFNNWDSRQHVLTKEDDFGVYSIFIEGVSEWARYKYCIVTSYGQTIFKSDPYAFFSDERPESIRMDILGKTTNIWNKENTKITMRKNYQYMKFI